MSPSDDALKLADADGAARTGRSWIVPAILGSALLMQTLSSTVVVTALPTMAHALHQDPLRLNLTITLFLLAQAVFMPVSGWLADKFGARRIFLFSVVLFALSSALCGFAQDLTQLILARMLQGMSGSMMIPVARLVLMRTTARENIVAAMSVLTMPAVLGPLAGPLLGGAIVTFADWRWIFFLNLPLAAACVGLVLAYVPNVREAKPPPLDVVGILLTGAGVASVMFGFENLQNSVVSGPVVAALFLGGAICLGLYGVHARRRVAPIIDLSIFRLQTFRVSVIGGAFARMTLASLPFLTALLFQIGFGMTAFAAGMMAFISAAGSLVMKTTTPPILRRFRMRTVLIVNAVIVAVGLAAYELMDRTTPIWIMMAIIGIGGFFRSLQFTCLNALVYAETGEHQISAASTTSSMAQQLTQSISVVLAAGLVQLMMRWGGQSEITAPVITHAFLAVGVLSLVSVFWFVRLPVDAGDSLSARPRS